MPSKSDTYVPAEDTFFLADYIQNEKGHSALEIGTGSGYITKILEKNFDLVIATDIDHAAIETQDQRIQNGVCCVSADALGVQFDFIVCNLPYLPSNDIQDQTVDGGKEGLEIPIQIIKSAKYRLKPGGKMLYLTSSLANYTKLMQQTELLGFDVSILAKKKLFFEELIIVKAVLSS